METAERQAPKKPDPYEAAIAEYNGVFTSMNDKGFFSSKPTGTLD